MGLNAIIFSNQWLYRILRHSLFWLFWFVVIVVSSPVGFQIQEGFMLRVLADSLFGLNTIIIYSPFCYFVLYIIIPKFFFRKKIFLGAFVLLCAFVALYAWGYTIVSVNYLLKIEEAPPYFDLKFFLFFHVLRFSGVLVCIALMCSLRFLKVWYVKQQQNLMLVRENAVAELQLLKAQVHPHFLFNTLNNIYSFTLTKSPLAADLLEKLSAILRYMILEGEKALVQLEKEIQMLTDYISLEKVRYGERLDIKTDIRGELENKLVAPLLMIPFVENAFKHGSSKLLKNPKVRLSIRVEDDNLVFELMNNKPLDTEPSLKANSKGGIGLKNARKRLELLYPGQHQLKIESTESTFSVRMKITILEVNDSTVNASLHKKTPFVRATA